MIRVHAVAESAGFACDTDGCNEPATVCVHEQEPDGVVFWYYCDNCSQVVPE